MTRRLAERWNHFFFAEEVPYGMALVRITLPLVLLIGVLPRWWHVRELYSADGSPSPLWINYGSAPLLPEPSAPVAVALFSILIASLLAASAGWMTRASLAVSCVLYACFGLLDSMATLTKYTVIASHVLLLLALSDCGSIWSVDAWLRRKTGDNGGRPARRPTSPVWPQRLLQLFIGIVYLGAAFTKMHTPAYFSGDQLTFWMLADTNFANPVGEFLTLYPAVLTVTAYVTILWEVMFVFLVWSSVWRIPALLLGVVFHVMTYFTLGLYVFPLVYMAVYFAYLRPAEIEWAAVLCKRAIARLRGARQQVTERVSPQPTLWLRPAYAAVAWGMLMATAAVLGVEIEHRRDVYGRRSPDGPPALKTIDAGQVKDMLRTSRNIRPQDMYFAFDVGTRTIGGVLSDRRDKFLFGERAVIQCSFTPPHPDIWIEVSLRGENGHVLKRIGQVVPRENLRSECYFDFDSSLAPGSYDFVLSYGGEELTRRRVTLSDRMATASL